MDKINYLESRAESLGAVNATLRRHAFALERIDDSLENIEYQESVKQEAN
ncbi:hypothetical protein N9025_01970 [Synechococcus sp. AH-707-B22]|nr:hypothetical protein [Synechococcus sp. AH-707-B22]